MDAFAWTSLGWALCASMAALLSFANSLKLQGDYRDSLKERIKSEVELAKAQAKVALLETLDGGS